MTKYFPRPLDAGQHDHPCSHLRGLRVMSYPQFSQSLPKLCYLNDKKMYQSLPLYSILSVGNIVS